MVEDAETMRNPPTLPEKKKTLTNSLGDHIHSTPTCPTTPSLISTLDNLAGE